MAKFDYFAATFDVDHVEILNVLHGKIDLSSVRNTRGKNGYEMGAEVHRGDHSIASVYWGGNAGTTHVLASGGDSAEVRECFVDQYQGRMRITRLDACEDWIEAGLFDKIAGIYTDYAVEHNLRINHQGDWTNNKQRTLYIGSRKSPYMIRLYEKGQKDGGDPNWVRLEAEIKPKKDARYAAANFTPGQVFECSRWGVEVLQQLGWDHLTHRAIGTVWVPSDAERARAALCRQYKNVIHGWVEEAGSPESFVQDLLAKLDHLDQPTTQPDPECVS